MKKLLITVLLLLLAGAGLGTEQSTIHAPDKAPDPVTKKPPAKTVQTDQKKVPWPRPYTPTEEISADSAVPFPTDI